MNPHKRIVSSLVAVTVAASGLACGDFSLYSGDEARSCHLVGCDSSVSWTGDIPRSSEPQMVLRFRLCKNGDCRADTQVFMTAAWSAGNSEADPDLNANCSTAPSGTVLTLSCRFPQTTNELEDGDEYDLTIVDEGTGATLVQKSVAVVYVAHQPNGPNCPPTCLNGSLGD